uniref:Uncharacterized protein n=1 Tax=Arundo donax TaxID=35708 RepID=A0A0A8ZE70_ARUDO
MPHLQINLTCTKIKGMYNRLDGCRLQAHAMSHIDSETKQLI